MTTNKNSTTDPPKRRKMPPARDPNSRERQMVSLAIDLAEQQLLKGTASSQVIAHYLKLGSSMAELERERLRSENLLLKAKTEALAAAKRVDELYANALAAMRSYTSPSVFNSGQETDDD